MALPCRYIWEMLLYWIMDDHMGTIRTWVVLDQAISPRSSAMFNIIESSFARNSTCDLLH